LIVQPMVTDGSPRSHSRHARTQPARNASRPSACGKQFAGAFAAGIVPDGGNLNGAFGSGRSGTSDACRTGSTGIMAVP
jgi:hypothetical protein